MLTSLQLQPLIDRHAAALRLYALQFCRWPEDAVQEAFIELASREEMPEHPDRWLYVVVRRRSLNVARSERRRHR
ncbi:MAG: sigma factor, partial [Planctomycetota bacterium]